MSRFWMSFDDLKRIAHQIHFYDHDAWMRDYDSLEIAEYLTQFDHFSSGERNWYEKDGWYPSRPDFIIWMYRAVTSPLPPTNKDNHHARTH